MRLHELDVTSRARVLIVEDEGIVARDLNQSLTRLGHSVCGTSPTGADALVQAERARPDIILMDIRLRGELDGIEAARLIREKQDVPVVFLTAYADRETLARAASVGPYGYVLKPFDERELQVTVLMALCKHRAFSALDQQVQQRTEELLQTEARYRRLQVVAQLGLFALGTPNTQNVLQHAVELVTQVLEVEFAGVFELEEPGDTLSLRAGVGWSPGWVGKASIATRGDGLIARVVSMNEPVHVRELASDYRFAEEPILGEHGVVSALCVPLQVADLAGSPTGVIGAYSSKRRLFSSGDANFLQAVANVVSTASLRSIAESQIRGAERMAEEQRVRASLAEQALHARDEFLSVASHELRTPVAVLQLQLEAMRVLVKPHEALMPRVGHKLDKMSSTVARLAKLIEGVLDVSRIALGRLQLDREHFDLAQLIREVAQQHQEAARRVGCELRLELPPTLVGAWDRGRLDQVLRNLLSNALKFGAGKPIHVALAQQQERVRLSVHDQGVGFDPAEVHRLVRRFERAVSHNKHGGLGLGLYIAEQIVKQHGGCMELSGKPAAGATCTVVLPLTPPAEGL